MKKLSLSELIILSLKKEKNLLYTTNKSKIIKQILIKFIIFFIMSIILNIFFGILFLVFVQYMQIHNFY